MALTLRTGEMLTSHLGLGHFMEYGSAGQDPNYGDGRQQPGSGRPMEVVNNLAVHAGLGFVSWGGDAIDTPTSRGAVLRGAYSLGSATTGSRARAA
jgi:hypothetical protein